MKVVLDQRCQQHSTVLKMGTGKLGVVSMIAELSQHENFSRQKECGRDRGRRQNWAGEGVRRAVPCPGQPEEAGGVWIRQLCQIQTCAPRSHYSGNAGLSSPTGLPEVCKHVCPLAPC